jgi:hypothetical protein
MYMYMHTCRDTDMDTYMLTHQSDCYNARMPFTVSMFTYVYIHEKIHIRKDIHVLYYGMCVRMRVYMYVCVSVCPSACECMCVLVGVTIVCDEYLHA